jgi:hypothetical protein
VGILQNIFAQLLQNIFQGGAGGIRKRRQHRRISRMTPDELSAWRSQELKRIHEQAVRLARFQSDKYLARHAKTRADAIRGYEVLLRNDRGVELSQPLLEGMDIRGLDLSSIRQGALKQEHVERAIGDSRTLLPAGLVAPSSWFTAVTPTEVHYAAPPDPDAPPSSTGSDGDDVDRSNLRRRRPLAVVVVAGLACLGVYLVLESGGSRGCAGSASTKPVGLGPGVTLTPSAGWRLLEHSKTEVALGCTSPTAAFGASYQPAPSPHIAIDLAIEGRAGLRQFGGSYVGSPTVPTLKARGFDRERSQSFFSNPSNPTEALTGRFYLLLDSATHEEVFAFAYSQTQADFNHVNADITRMLSSL